VALLEGGTITRVGTHAELLSNAPEYRYLLAADEDLDDGSERNCDWEQDEDRSRLDHMYQEREAEDYRGLQGGQAAMSACAKSRRNMSTDWRGRAVTNDDDDLPIDESSPGARRPARCLVRCCDPYATTVALLAIVVVLEKRRPAFRAAARAARQSTTASRRSWTGGSTRELLSVVATLCCVVLVQAVSRMYFLRRSGRIGQEVLLELRRRIFRHFQRLDVAFHDRYNTSGRVVARSTNDVEAIQDMLETGFDGLITAVLTLCGTAVLLVVLDVRLGLGVPVRVPRPGGAGVVVPHPIVQDVPEGPGKRPRWSSCSSSRR